MLNEKVGKFTFLKCVYCNPQSLDNYFFTDKFLVLGYSPKLQVYQYFMTVLRPHVLISWIGIFQ